jgi:hypothetical protein
LALDEGYLLGVGGVEVPIGTIDHDFFEGAPAVVAAALLGIERRPFSVIGYGFLHRYAERHELRESGHTFLGAGVAWTPIDAPQAGRLFSVQFGLSHETTAREVFHGARIDDTGGWALVAHPTVAWSTSEHVLFFVSTSLPLADQWRNTAERERFRIGTGAIVSLGD